ncbi:MAG: DNA segregation ATPase FtsK/SpoIIIE, S-DNA-T family, partial [Parcubacteria group bacterium Gr01-1014_70]
MGGAFVWHCDIIALELVWKSGSRGRWHFLFFSPSFFIGPQTGGYIGFGIAYAPLRFFDTTASAVLFGAVFVISLLLMFNTALVPPPKEKGDEETTSSLFWRMLGFFRKTPQPADAAAPTVSGAGSLDAHVPQADNKPVIATPTLEQAQSVSGGGSPTEEILPNPPIVRRRVSSGFKTPSFDILEPDRGKPSSGDVRANANIIQRTLQSFGIDVDMSEVHIGPSVTQYTLKPAEGVKLSRITNLSSNLGLALAAHPLRIEAPIPGKSLVGIEVPNKSILFVGMRSLLTELANRKNEYQLGFALGRDVTGQAVFADLARMPHLLIAGSTGSGKSVTIHSLLMGLLFFHPPEFLRCIMIDPKRVELTHYNGVPHLISPVITDPKKAIQALRWAVGEMDKRLGQLEAASARDIASYNADTGNEDIMPYMVIVIDELADLMAMYPREVEGSIVRIAQMARAVGIHLVISTQRPSVDVITGLIKANIPTRIALQTVSQIDSRTILDMGGAEKLLGKGDMLYLPGDAAKPRRIQGVYVSDGEVKRIARYLQSVGEDAEETSLVNEDIFA